MRLEQVVPAVSSMHLEGVFDGLAARRLEALLVDAPAGAPLEIDLTQIREFHDFGIAVLGHALTLTRARVTLRGLRHHQVRVLQYFGVDTGAVERAISSDAA